MHIILSNRKGHNAATTKPLPSAVDAAVNAMTEEDFGNPSSLHQLGLTASQTVSVARKTKMHCSYQHLPHAE